MAVSYIEVCYSLIVVYTGNLATEGKNWMYIA